MQKQLSFDFDIWYKDSLGLNSFSEGTYLDLYYINIENMVVGGLYKIIKHYKDSVEVLFHYKHNKDKQTFRSSIIKHSQIVKFKEWYWTIET